MSRALLVLSTDEIRKRAKSWIDKLPEGTRVTFQEPKRTLPQNNLLWKLLTDVATTRTHCGRKYPPDVWKAIFMSALGKEMQFVPSLNGQGLIPLGHRSSELSVKECIELIDFIEAWLAKTEKDAA